MNKIPRKKTERGFTLLLAALVSSIVLALGSSIFLIAQKQVLLSSLGRDSQFAFYAADAAAECALYWDVKNNPSDSNNAPYNAFGTSAPSFTPVCDGTALNTSGRESAPPYVMEFSQDFFVNADGVSGTSDDLGYCVEVKVYKNEVNPFTVIHSDGYSVPCAAKSTSGRALQRSVELHY